MESKFNWNEKYKTKSKYRYLDHFSVIPAENGHVDETFDQPKYDIPLLLNPRLETNTTNNDVKYKPVVHFVFQ